MRKYRIKSWVKQKSRISRNWSWCCDIRLEKICELRESCGCDDSSGLYTWVWEAWISKSKFKTFPRKSMWKVKNLSFYQTPSKISSKPPNPTFRVKIQFRNDTFSDQHISRAHLQITPFLTSLPAISCSLTSIPDHLHLQFCTPYLQISTTSLCTLSSTITQKFTFEHFGQTFINIQNFFKNFTYERKNWLWFFSHDWENFF